MNVTREIEANPYSFIEVNPVSVRNNGFNGRHSEYRRQTIIECAHQKIEVSTVGRIITRDGLIPVGADDWYETMVWMSENTPGSSREFELDKYFRRVKDKEAYDEADEIHDKTVSDIVTRLHKGEFFKEGVDYYDHNKED